MKWADLKARAMKDSFKTDSLYKRASTMDNHLLDKLIDAQSKQKDLKELQHTEISSRHSTTEIKFEEV